MLTRPLPGAIATVIRMILPPVLPAANARLLLSAGDQISAVLPALLHVGANALVLLGVGTWLLARRRPEENV